MGNMADYRAQAVRLEGNKFHFLSDEERKDFQDAEAEISSMWHESVAGLNEGLLGHAAFSELQVAMGGRLKSLPHHSRVRLLGVEAVRSADAAADWRFSEPSARRDAGMTFLRLCAEKGHGILIFNNTCWEQLLRRLLEDGME